MHFSFQRPYVVPKNAPTVWRKSSGLVRKLAKRLKRMLLASEIFAEDFKPLKVP
jgi:hypothetical protein